MSVQIPLVTSVPWFKIQTTLDNITYGLEFLWNETSGGWYMSLFDVDDNLIQAGRRVTLETPLCTRGRTGAEPPGLLMAFDTSGQQELPGLDDLQSRVVLVYFSPDEVEAIL
jgi:hypothetical protein